MHEARPTEVLHQPGAGGAPAEAPLARRRTCGRVAASVLVGCAILATILGLGLRVNLSTSVPWPTSGTTQKPPSGSLRTAR
jgi:hypothetical protein